MDDVYDDPECVAACLHAGTLECPPYVVWLKANWERDLKRKAGVQGDDDHLTITSMCEAFEPFHPHSSWGDADDIDNVVEARLREMNQAHIDTLEAKGYL